MSNRKPVYIIYERDVAALNECKYEIFRLIRANRLIPAALMDRLFSIIESRGKWPIQMIERSERIERANYKMAEYAEQVLSCFSAHGISSHYDLIGKNEVPEYNFDGSEDKEPTIKGYIKVEYSLGKLIEYCIWEYIINADSKSKKDAVMTFYVLVNQYINGFMNDKDKEKLTMYKRYVISGHLTNVVSGFRLIEPQKPHTTKAIYQAVRNTLRGKK